MANLDLWQRVWGDEGGDGTAEDAKIPLHAFWGMIQEWDEGYEHQSNVLATFNVATGIQNQQAAAIKSRLNDCPDKQAFIRMAKNWSYTAEAMFNMETDKYRDFAVFEARMDAEVAAQAGS